MQPPYVIEYGSNFQYIWHLASHALCHSGTFIGTHTTLIIVLMFVQHHSL